jgi:hypothetical protein
MKPFADPQEIARRFNEEETIWREYVRLRRLRHRCGLGVALPSDLLDRLDWLMAERKGRIVRCIGKVLS